MIKTICHMILHQRFERWLLWVATFILGLNQRIVWVRREYLLGRCSCWLNQNLKTKNISVHYVLYFAVTISHLLDLNRETEQESECCSGQVVKSIKSRTTRSSVSCILQATFVWSSTKEQLSSRPTKTASLRRREFMSGFHGSQSQPAQFFCHIIQNVLWLYMPLAADSPGVFCYTMASSLLCLRFL